MSRTTSEPDSKVANYGTLIDSLDYYNCLDCADAVSLGGAVGGCEYEKEPALFVTEIKAMCVQIVTQK
jgi:hypothetical protein